MVLGLHLSREGRNRGTGNSPEAKVRRSINRLKLEGRIGVLDRFLHRQVDGKAPARARISSLTLKDHCNRVASFTGNIRVRYERRSVAQKNRKLSGTSLREGDVQFNGVGSRV